jgi:hypothetical protein
MTIEERKTMVEPSEELSTIILGDERPEKSTRIGVNLTPQDKRVNNLLPEKQQGRLRLEPRRHARYRSLNHFHKLNVNPCLRPIK